MKSKKMIVYRIMIVGALLILQVAWLMLSLLTFSNISPVVNMIFRITSIIALFVVINSRQNPAYKLAWAVPILIFPLLGGMMFVFFGTRQPSKKLREKLNESWEKLEPLTAPTPGFLEEVWEESETVYGQVRYLNDYANAPLWKNTLTKYFKSGEENFPYIVEELKKAEHFIFMEYFIIDEGIMWGRILEILARKAAEGVDVRVMYDGTCEFALLPHDYPKRLQALGIRCKIFAPVTPFVSTHYNYRDHRKILVIDGQVAFNGGVNLADEYINQKKKFGHWKDAALMLKGEAVKSFTLMFLQMWGIDERENIPLHFLSGSSESARGTKGYVIPYGDCPLDNDKLGERVYMDILNRSLQYVHIMTPYLILDGEMETALKFAAERGVEVVILLPGIADKSIPYALAKTHYASLLESGVKLYEYTPGFVHAKVFVSDAREAVVGTINLDYRSLYHHFECATYLYQTDCISEIEADFQSALGKCRQVTMETARKERCSVKLVGCLMKAIAPLL